MIGLGVHTWFSKVLGAITTFKLRLALNASRTSPLVGPLGSATQVATSAVVVPDNEGTLHTIAAGEVAIPYARYSGGEWYATDADGNDLNISQATVSEMTQYLGHTAWSPSTAYALNDIKYDKGRLYQCSTSGTSGALPGGLLKNHASEINVVFDGNSLTVGTGVSAGETYPEQFAQFFLGKSTVTNLGVSSQTTQDMLADVASQVQPLYNGAKFDNVAVVWEGTNDLYFGATAAQAYANLVSYCQAVRSYGFKAIILTITPRSNGSTPASFESDRQTVNASIRTNWESFADGIVDVGADVAIGPDDAELNTTYYGDLVHMTVHGYARVGLLVAREIERVCYSGTVDDGTAVWDYLGKYSNLNASLGILNAQAHTNTIPYSHTFDATGWTVASLTVSKTAYGADAAANTGTVLTDATGATLGSTGYATTVTNDSSSHWVSCLIAKSGKTTSYPGLRVRLQGGTTEKTGSVTINPARGTVTVRTDVAENAYDDVVVHDYGFFWRVCMKITNNSTGNTTLRVLLNAAVAASFTGTWTATAQGSQIFHNVDATADELHYPVYTGGSVGVVDTRHLTIDGTDIQPTLSLTVESNEAGGSRQLSLLDDGTNHLYVDSSGQLVFTDGVDTMTGSTFNLVAGSPVTIGLDLTDGSRGITVDGSEVATDTGGAVSWGATVSVGADSSSTNNFNGSITVVN